MPSFGVGVGSGADATQVVSAGPAAAQGAHPAGRHGDPDDAERTQVIPQATQLEAFRAAGASPASGAASPGAARAGLNGAVPAAEQTQVLRPPVGSEPPPGEPPRIARPAAEEAGATSGAARPRKESPTDVASELTGHGTPVNPTRRDDDPADGDPAEARPR
jgi:hypothetical protein